MVVLIRLKRGVVSWVINQRRDECCPNKDWGSEHPSDSRECPAALGCGGWIGALSLVL